jgi:hypothetical protein
MKTKSVSAHRNAAANARTDKPREAVGKAARKPSGKEKGTAKRAERSADSPRAASAHPVLLGASAPAGLASVSGVAAGLPSAVSGAAAEIQKWGHDLLFRANGPGHSSNEIKEGSEVHSDTQEGNRSLLQLGMEVTGRGIPMKPKQYRSLKETNPRAFRAVEDKANTYIRDNNVDVLKMKEKAAHLDDWKRQFLGSGRFFGWGHMAIEEALKTSPSMAYAAMDVIEKNPGALEGLKMSILYRIAFDENLLGTVSSLIDGSWREEIHRAMKNLAAQRPEA